MVNIVIDKFKGWKVNWHNALFYTVDLIALIGILYIFPAAVQMSQNFIVQVMIAVSLTISLSRAIWFFEPLFEKKVNT